MRVVILVAAMAWAPGSMALADVLTLDLTQSDLPVLNENRWSSAKVGDAIGLRVVDADLDTVVTLRVNMKKDKGTSRVLGARIEGQEEPASLLVEWAATHVRAVLLLTDHNVSYVVTSRGGEPVEVQKRPIDEAICGGASSKGIPVDPAQAFEPPASQTTTAAVASGAAPVFNSNPGATSVILLDFDGHTVSGTFWNSGYNGGNDIVAAPYDVDGDPSTFGAYEREMIRVAFDEVADDFAPFTINVTTSETVFQQANPFSRMRVIITPTNYFFPGYGGVAFYHSFAWGNDTPVWTWNRSLNSMGETCSHEVGHAVGLFHDGGPLGFAAPTYYGGYDTGDGLHWSPIMGAYFGRGIKQWSRGEYPQANNQQDDLATMVGLVGQGYGFTYRTDDVGNGTTSAKPLRIAGTKLEGGSTFERVQTSGVVSEGADVDVFSFVAKASGTASLLIEGAKTLTSNFGVVTIGSLDVQAQLLDASGRVLLTVNQPGILDAAIVHPVTAGQLYHLAVTGVGKGDPAGFGIPDYASLGKYEITGTLPLEAGGGREIITATKSPISIDGQLDEGWALAPRRSFKPLFGSRDGDQDLSGTWRALWDEDKLYVMAEVIDDKIVSDSLHAWDDDALEIFLDLGGKRATRYGATDYQYAITARDAVISLGVNSAPAVPGVSAKRMLTPNGYRIEVAIPWNRSAGFTPAEGAPLGIEVHVADDDDGGSRDAKLSWWGNTDSAWNDPSTFALASLEQAADVLASSTTTAPAIDGHVEALWHNVPQNHLEKRLRGATSDGAFWRAVADTQALYLLVDVTDDVLTNDSTAPWEDDAVELFLDLAGNGGSRYDADDVQLVFRWNDDGAYLGVNSAEVNEEGVRYEMVRTGRGYRLEAAIAWSALPKQPAVEAFFGIDVHVNDDDDGANRDRKAAWRSATDDTWQNPSLMGRALRSASVTPAVAIVPWAKSAPTIDGSLAEWSNTAWRPIDRVLKGNTSGPADLLSGWQARATGQALYIAVRVQDDLLVSDSPNAWEDDSVEIYLDGNGSRGSLYDGVDDAQWVVRVNDGRVYLGVNSIPATGVTLSQQHQASGAGQLTTLELKVPWTALGGRPRDRFGLDVHVNDDDDGAAREGKQSWFGASDDGWTRPASFAEALLGF